MKQKQLIKEVNAACLVGDNEKLVSLRIIEFKKIAERKAKNKPFSARWTSLKL